MFSHLEKAKFMGINLLVALFQEEGSYGNKMLQAQGVTRLKILNEIAHDLDKSINSENARSKITRLGEKTQVRKKKGF